MIRCIHVWMGRADWEWSWTTAPNRWQIQTFQRFWSSSTLRFNSIDRVICSHWLSVSLLCWLSLTSARFEWKRNIFLQCIIRPTVWTLNAKVHVVDKVIKYTLYSTAYLRTFECAMKLFSIFQSDSFAI